MISILQCGKYFIKRRRLGKIIGKKAENQKVFLWKSKESITKQLTSRGITGKIRDMNFIYSTVQYCRKSPMHYLTLLALAKCMVARSSF